MEAENGRLRRAVADLTLDNQILKEAARGNSRGERYGISERRACRALEQPRSTQRYTATVADDEEALTILASRYGRYGYRRVTAMLQWEGWRVNHKVADLDGKDSRPAKQPKRGRLWPLTAPA